MRGSPATWMPRLGSNSRTACGESRFFAAIMSSVRAPPDGARRPCSHSCSVRGHLLPPAAAATGVDVDRCAKNDASTIPGPMLKRIKKEIDAIDQAQTSGRRFRLGSPN